MKAHSNQFKTNIVINGRQLDSKITYELNGETIELGVEELNSISPHYKGDILKSVMKQLDIDSNVDIPLGTEINYQFGVKVDNSYEYLDFGNYIVYSSEKQEDLYSYKIVAYDKMLYSMKNYESLGITYPISIRDYINAICTHLGLTFANSSDTFANYNRMIQSELYLDSQGNSMDYKFRDVLDELAQATGSTICINNDDELEIRYITNTNDTIDEEFFKDINVNFGEKYGPINSIVLSRSGGADNVYLQDQQSIEQNGLCEIKISDNQIMNWNDRSDYLPDLLSQLGGIEYYLNDYSSIGITYYDLCDRYNVQIDENTYSCVMFNDEINVTQGLKENVYTERPIQSETDYSKADKTDRRINQTYFIVDKQNQTIKSVIKNTTDTSNPDSIASKQSVLTQRVDSLESAISDIADITITGESSYATVDLDNINESEPIVINVRPLGTNISYLYPRDNLYPSDTLFMTDRKVLFHNNTTNEDISYILPDDLLYYDSNNYDEFMLDYNSQTCKVTKKCKYNADGTVSLLSSPTINTYTYPAIELTEGDYTISLSGYSQGYIFVRLMTNNIYTDQFYTKAETNSKINQTASEITANVNQTLSNYSTTQEMNSAITLKANEINSSVAETYATKTTTNQLSSRISQTAKSIGLSVNNGSISSGITITTTKEDGTTETAQGTIQMNGLVSFTNLSTSGQTTINGANIQTGTITANQVNSSIITTSNFSAQNINASNITSGTLSVDRINAKSITADKIEDKGITDSKIADNTITDGKIATSTITGSKIANGTITGTNIANATITNAKIADATITNAKISSLSANKITTGTLTSREINNGSGTFKVTTGGTVTASSGTIGGWHLTSNRLYQTSSYNSHQYSLRSYGVSDDTSGISQYWGIIMQGSDKNLKNNIEDIDDKYEKFFDDLKPKTFYFNKNVADEKKHFGFVAQDILESQKLIDEDLSMVEKPIDSKYYNLDKRELIALNTWQIQKLKQENKELKGLIDELRKDIEELKKGR